MHDIYGSCSSQGPKSASFCQLQAALQLDGWEREDEGNEVDGKEEAHGQAGTQED